ncbi:MAG: CBS domain-containing protein [Polyangiales bacterium]
MNAMPRRVGQHMTATPVCIGLDADLEDAVKLMQEHGIRHLPVMDGEDLTGVVTDRDLAMIESLLPEEWEQICVAEAMTPEPYTVTPDAALWEVAQRMAREKFGCAVVTDDEGTVVGVFTTTDALRVLADLAEREA